MRKKIFLIILTFLFISREIQAMSLGPAAAEAISSQAVKRSYLERFRGWRESRKAQKVTAKFRFGDATTGIDPNSDLGKLFYRNFDDLNQQAEKGSFGVSIFRERTVRAVREKLTSRKFPNVVLVSKTSEEADSVIQALVQKTVTGDVPHEMSNTRFIEWKVGSSTSKENATYTYGVEGNITKAFEAVDEFIRQIKEKGVAGQGKEDIVVVIREFNELLSSKTSNKQDTIVSYIQKRFNNEFGDGKRDIRFLVTVTEHNFEEHMASNPIRKYFQLVKTDEFGYQEVVDALIKNKNLLEIEADDDLIRHTVVLVSRYYSNDPLLEKSQQILSLIRKKALGSVYDTPIELEELPAKINALRLEIEEYEKAKAAIGKTNPAVESKVSKLRESLSELELKRDKLQALWKAKQELLPELKAREKVWREAQMERIRVKQAYDAAVEKNSGVSLDSKTIAHYDKLSAAAGAAEREAFEQYEYTLNQLTAIDEINRVRFDERDLARIISEDTGIPVDIILKSDLEKFRTFFDDLDEMGFRGQERAVMEFYEAIKVSEVDDMAKKPASLINLNGPSGTGKTLLSEFASKILGRKYVSIEGAGLTKAKLEKELASALSLNPYALVNIDEIETISPGALDLLLFLRERGYFIYEGRRISCHNAIITTTSNVGYTLPDEVIAKTYGGLQKQEQRRLLLEQVGRIEKRLVNRFDHLIQFNSHNLTSTGQMVDDQVNKVIDIYFKLGIDLEVTPKYREFLTALSLDTSKGGRTVGEVIDSHIKSPVQEARIRGEIKPGDTYILDIKGPEQLNLGF